MDSISTSGFIQNTLNQGITPYNALSEYTDGSKDARATEVHIRLVTMGEIIYHSDNGVGMSKTQLERANVRCDRREDVDTERTGFFGDGKKRGASVLTQNEAAPTTTSRGEDGLLHTIAIDFPTAIRTGKLTLLAVPLPRSSDEWDEYAVDSAGVGTVDKIPCAHAQFETIKRGVQSGELLNRYRKLYRECITREENPLVIVFHIDEEEFSVGHDDIFEQSEHKFKGWDLRVTETPDGGIRTCFRPPGTTNFHYFAQAELDSTEHSVKLPTEVLCIDKPPPQVIGTIDLLSILNNDAATGGFHVQRGDRILDTVPHAVVTSGDMGARDYYMGTHHIVRYTPSKEMDKKMGVQVDKGSVHRDNINRNIRMTIEKLVDGWVKTEWKSIKPKKDKNVVKGKDAIIDSLRKQLVARDAECASKAAALAAALAEIERLAELLVEGDTTETDA